VIFTGFISISHRLHSSEFSWCKNKKNAASDPGGGKYSLYFFSALTTQAAINLAATGDAFIGLFGVAQVGRYTDR
jgi:hypothetical protein